MLIPLLIYVMIGAVLSCAYDDWLEKNAIYYLVNKKPNRLVYMTVFMLFWVIAGPLHLYRKDMGWYWQ